MTMDTIRINKTNKINATHLTRIPESNVTLIITCIKSFGRFHDVLWKFKALLYTLSVQCVDPLTSKYQMKKRFK